MVAGLGSPGRHHLTTEGIKLFSALVEGLASWEVGRGGKLNRQGTLVGREACPRKVQG